MMGSAAIAAKAAQLARYRARAERFRKTNKAAHRRKAASNPCHTKSSSAALSA
jgi:hypothetical protein